MCLAVPAEVISLDGEGFAEVELSGVRHRVCVDLVPGVGLGDFVIVHAGFAISVLNSDEAQQTLELFAALSSAVDSRGLRSPDGEPDAETHAVPE